MYVCVLLTICVYIYLNIYLIYFIYHIYIYIHYIYTHYIYTHYTHTHTRTCMRSPGGSDSKESICNSGDLSLIQVGKIPWRRKWQPTPVFLPGESHGQRSLVCYSPWGRKESDMTEWLILTLYMHTCTHTHTHTFSVFLWRALPNAFSSLASLCLSGLPPPSVPESLALSLIQSKLVLSNALSDLSLTHWLKVSMASMAFRKKPQPS